MLLVINITSFSLGKNEKIWYKYNVCFYRDYSTFAIIYIIYCLKKHYSVSGISSSFYRQWFGGGYLTPLSTTFQLSRGAVLLVNDTEVPEQKPSTFRKSLTQWFCVSKYVWYSCHIRLTILRSMEFTTEAENQHLYTGFVTFYKLWKERV